MHTWNICNKRIPNERYIIWVYGSPNYQKSDQGICSLYHDAYLNYKNVINKSIIPIEGKIPIGRMIPIESVNVGILKISIKSNDWYILKLNFKTQVQWSINAQTMLYIWVDPFCIEIKQQKDNGQIIYKD